MLPQIYHKLRSNWTFCSSFTRAFLQFLVLVVWWTQTAAQPSGADTRARQAPIVFDIPAQSLADAIYTYSSATGIEVLVPGDVLAHRRSSTVVGIFRPEAALSALLAGSGLISRPAGENAITLVPTVRTPSATARVPRYPEYSAALQVAVGRALCQLHETQPGGYRVAARLWVGASGEVTHVAFLDTTGDAHRDAALATLLKKTVVSEPPPPDMPQPTTLVVLPRQDATGCDFGVKRRAR